MFYAKAKFQLEPPTMLWIHVYIWLSPFIVHLKLSQHC